MSYTCSDDWTTCDRSYCQRERKCAERAASAPAALPVEALTLGITDEEIDLIAADGMRNAAGGIYATSVYDFAHGVERAVLARWNTAVAPPVTLEPDRDQSVQGSQERDHPMYTHAATFPAQPVEALAPSDHARRDLQAAITAMNLFDSMPTQVAQLLDAARRILHAPPAVLVEPAAEPDVDALCALAVAGYRKGLELQGKDALIELVAADDAHEAWCEVQRQKPHVEDPMASVSSLGITVKDDPERAAVIERLNRAWESARRTLAAHSGVTKQPAPGSPE